MHSGLKFSGLGVCAVLSAFSIGCGTGKDDGTDTTSGGSSAGTSTTPGGSTNGGATNGGATNGGATSGGSTSSAVSKLYTFDLDNEQFALNKTPSADPMYTNLGDTAAAPDAEAMAGWTGSRDFDPGATNKGCLMLSANFTGWNQQLAIEVAGPVDKDGAPIDLTNKILRAQVYLEKGLSPFTTSDAPGGIVFFIKSGTDYAWGQAPWTNLQGYGSWTSVKFSTSNPDSGSSKSWDPSNPVALGFQLSSGGGNMHTADEFGPAQPTVVCIDNVTMQDE